jgi:hypothetical protein
MLAVSDAVDGIAYKLPVLPFEIESASKLPSNMSTADTASEILLIGSSCFILSPTLTNFLTSHPALLDRKKGPLRKD